MSAIDTHTLNWGKISAVASFGSSDDSAELQKYLTKLQNGDPLSLEDSFNLQLLIGEKEQRTLARTRIIEASFSMIKQVLEQIR